MTLINLAISGDAEAFGVLYRTHHQAIYRYIYPIPIPNGHRSYPGPTYQMIGKKYANKAVIGRIHLQIGHRTIVIDSVSTYD